MASLGSNYVIGFAICAIGVCDKTAYLSSYCDLSSYYYLSNYYCWSYAYKTGDLAAMTNFMIPASIPNPIIAAKTRAI